MNKSLFIAIGLVVVLGIQENSWALPSFARQTGQPCGSCHADFPQLTPFGRQFKLNGYTMGAANNTVKNLTDSITNSIATNTAASNADASNATAASTATTNAAISDPAASNTDATHTEKNFWFPPISIMGVEGFTHTQAPQDNSGTSLKPNDNFLFQSASIFYGGAITDHIGAFAQATYSAPGFGPPPEFKYSWDNTDIRFANTATIANIPFIYGVTVNNNPTVQDVWNTTPAWSFPFVSSSLAPTPSAKPIISQEFAASVVGAGAYTYINNLVYIEATGYQTLSQSTQKTLGIDPTNTPGEFKNIAPYFRIAAEPNWGNNYLEIGTFGMYANVEPQPWNFDDIGTDSYFDLGVDSQYQYMGSKYIVTLRNSIIMENQDLDASFDNGLASNENNYLGTLNTQASFVYGENFRLPLTVGYFDTWGSEDELLYADNGNFSPNSTGWITEIAYIPFGMDKAPIWPWLNARIGVQYIWYNEFNGVTGYNSVLDTKASDNNTLYAYIWLTM